MISKVIDNKRQSMKSKGLKILFYIVLALVVLYLLGPKMPAPEFDTRLPAFAGGSWGNNND